MGPEASHLPFPKRLVLWLAVFAALAAGLRAQETERRLALVIGNGAYQTISPLRNPVNDGEDVSSALGRLGFEVTTLLDGTKRQMYAAVRKFGEDLRRYDIGLFYYAGHGLQFEGRNFLVAVDADIRQETDIPFEATDLARVLAEMEGAGSRVNIVILDACRNNPYASRLRSAGRGLSVVKAPTGSLIVYATAPGDVAVDGPGRNGIFTEAFLKHLEKAGAEVEVLLKDVRRDVQTVTGGRQIPWTASSLTETFYFKAPAAPAETGSLAIAGIPDGVRVALDGEDVTGRLRELPEGGRILERIPAGNRTLVFEGPFTARTEMQAQVGANRTTMLDPVLAVLGRLRLSVSRIPESAHAEAVVTFRNFEGIRQGRFRITEGYTSTLPPGAYQVSLAFADDQTPGYEGTTLVEKGRETVLNLQLDYSTPYKLRGMESRRTDLTMELSAIQKRRKYHDLGARISIGLGILSSVVSGILYYQGSSSMDSYRGATNANDATHYREVTERYSKAFTATIIGAGVCLGGGVLSLLLKPDTRPIEREIENLDRSIKLLGEGIKK